MGDNVTEEHQPAEQLAQLHEQLWQTVLQFGNLSAVQERNRIARDLHDSLGHALTALNIQLQTAIKLWQLDPTQAQHFLAEAHRLGAVAISEVRQSVGTLRSNATETQTLDSLIEALAEDFYETTGVLPVTQIDLPRELPVEIVTPLYRVVQEALNNARKYAQATEVQIQICYEASRLWMTIQDDGRGFKPEKATTGFGLKGIRERVAMLRGNLYLESEPGAGCRISIDVPLQGETIAEKQTDCVSTSVSVLEPETPSTGLALTPGQTQQLEQSLTKWIGPIAPQLLQSVVCSTPSVEALTKALASYLNPDALIQFEQEATQAMTETTIQFETKAQDVSAPKSLATQPQSIQKQSIQKQSIQKQFIQECEQELMVEIGPIASLLVQKTLNQHPGLSSEELIKTLAEQIPNPQAAIAFQQRLTSS
jgi:two-component sensor histidine kinase